MAPLPYHGPLRLGDHGTLVNAAKRAVYRTLGSPSKWKGFAAQTVEQRRTFGHAFRDDLTLAQRARSAGRTEGVFDEPTLRALEQAGFDAEARRLWLAWRPAPPPVPPLVEPYQGFGSLVDDLWRPFTIGRGMGLKDGPGTASGTYNPASRLPSGAASDHATSRLDGRVGMPACAFDLDIGLHVGYQNPLARAFFQKMCGRAGVHYVILGDRIWSTEKGFHAYGDSASHSNHVHTSGFRR